jgi:hypothetical protein
MAWLIFALVTLVALGRFVDFVIGSRGTRRLKDRFVEFYVAVEVGNWSSLLSFGSDLYLKYLNSLIGKSIIRPKPLLMVFVYSISLNSTVFGSLLYYGIGVDPDGFRRAMAGMGGASFQASSWWTIATMYVLMIATNYVIDVVALATLRTSLTRLQVGGNVKPRKSLLVLLGLTYVLIGAATWLATANYCSFAFPPESSAAHYERVVLWCLLLTGPLLVAPWGTIILDPHLIKFSLAVALPITTYIIVLIFMSLLYNTQRVTKPLLSGLLERLEEAKSGIFTTVASAFALIVGVLTAAQKLF